MIKKKILWKQFGKECARTVLILLAGILIGFFALCLVHLLPVDRMHQNVLEAKDAINAHAQTIPGYVSTSIDNYTDSIMLNEAICPVDVPLIEKAIYNYQVNYFRQYDQQENLLRYLDGEEGYGYQGYTHYWGGHQVVLKLLLLAFDYADILLINLILQTFLLIFIVIGLYKTKKNYVILPFLVAILTIMPMTIGVCLQFCDIYYILLIGSAYIVWKKDKIKTGKMYLVFLILGMCTSYFDFLTYPLLSLGIPLVIALAYIDFDGINKKVLYPIVYSIAWGVGYLGMWAGKWILGSILLPEAGALDRALISISYRGSNRAGGEVITLFDVLLKNLYVYLKWPIIILMGTVTVYFIFLMINRKHIDRANLRLCLPYLFICLYPLGWYMVAKNHSYEHAFMAYRELAITTFAGLCLLSRIADRKEEL